MKFSDLKNLAASLVGKKEKVIDEEVKVIDAAEEAKKAQHQKQKDFINFFTSLSRKQKRKMIPAMRGKKPVQHCKRCGSPWNNVNFVGTNENCKECSSIIADERRKKRRRKRR